MTITELQAYVDTKPDLRELINTIVDFMQANPGGGGGGGGDTIYSADGALSSDRTVDLNGKVLNFNNGNNNALHLDPTVNNETVQLGVTNPTGTGNIATYQSATTPTTSDFLVDADYQDSTEIAIIQGHADAAGSNIDYVADSHTFAGTYVPSWNGQPLLVGGIDGVLSLNQQLTDDRDIDTGAFNLTVNGAPVTPIPDQTGNDGKYLGTAAGALEWQTFVSSVPSLSDVLTASPNALGIGLQNVGQIYFNPGSTSQFYMWSPNGNPWIVSIANDGTLSVVDDS